MNPLEYEALMKPMRIYEVIERGMNPGTDTGRRLAENQAAKSFCRPQNVSGTG